MFFVKDNTIDKWFSSLSHDERKSLLSDLHYLRRTLISNNANNVNNLRNLIDELEELHDKKKSFRDR